LANSLRAVQSRINSTKSTAQITKAMYMVSQSKVKKAEKTYKSYMDFMQRIASMVSELLDNEMEDVHPLLKPREVKKTAYFIITSDRGLAGSYNSSLFKELDEKIKEEHANDNDFVTAAVGKQGFAYLKRKNYPLYQDSATFVRDDVMFVDIVPLAKNLLIYI